MQAAGLLTVFLASSDFKEGVITHLSVRPLILGVVEEGVVTAERRVLPVDVDWRPVAEVTDLLVFVAVLQNEQITCGFALSLLFWIVSKTIEQIRECTCLQHTEHCVKGLPFLPFILHTRHNVRALDCFAALPDDDAILRARSDLLCI